MTKNTQELAKTLKLIPTYSITEEESAALPDEEWFRTDNGPVRYDFNVSDEEMHMLIEMKNYKNIRLIKNIVLSAAILTLASVAVTAFYIIKMASSLSFMF